MKLITIECKINGLRIKIAVIMFVMLSVLNCFAQKQNRYTSYIKVAEQHFQYKEYLKAAQFYSKAFSSNGNLGLVRDRYEAARCWALAGIVDSAFFQLERAMEGNFGEYAEADSDAAFADLKADSRWLELLNSIKENGMNQNKHLKWQFKKINKPLAEMLDTVFYDDQHPRKQMREIEKIYGSSSPQMDSLTIVISQKDSINREKVKRIIDKYGWLGKEDIGEQGNLALFLVIQHANLAMQIKYMPIIRQAATEGKVEASSLAILEDRIAVMQGKKQIYGSQLLQVGGGKLYVQPIADPQNVDQRRAAVGLPSMREYLSRFSMGWSIEQYEKDIKELRKYKVTH